MRNKHFTVDARAILTWGRQSIRDRTTAVIELVKNSYDAGAEIVEVEVSVEPDDQPAFIRIADAGEGMSERDVDLYWLRIGYSGKLDSPITKKGRRKTGEKGIGRISADRLGALLELRTQKRKHPGAGLLIDWRDFENGGRKLEDVEIRRLDDSVFPVPFPSKLDKQTGRFGPAPEPHESSRERPGTQLVISELRDEWRAEDATELHRALSLLVPPFEQVEDFQIRLVTDINKDLCGVVDSPFYRAAEIEAEFSLSRDEKIACAFKSRDLRGKARKSYKEAFSWGEFIHPGNQEHGASKPRFGPTRVKLLFYPRRAETLRGTDLVLSELREFLNLNAGVKVYRDNIRVMSYGDVLKPEGDWLALGDRKARSPAGPGRVDYRVSPYQLVGAVYLGRDSNPEILDTTGREGLIHGDHFDELRAFVIGCVFRLEAHYRRLFSERKKDLPLRSRSQAVVDDLRVNLKAISTGLRKIEGSLPQESKKILESALRLVDSARKIEKVDESLEELASQPTVYRGLATLGIASTTFGHETLGSIEAVEFTVGTAIDLLTDDTANLDSALEELGKALSATETISAWGKFTLDD